MSVRITDKDRGFKALLARLKKASARKVVDVGIMGKEASASHGAGLTNVEVASFHEFGQGVPERSFIRVGVDQNTNAIQALQRRLMKGVVLGKLTQDKALSILGLDVQSKIQSRIESNIPPPLKQATIDRKRSSVALIDTGQMKNSVTWQIREAA